MFDDMLAQLTTLLSEDMLNLLAGLGILLIGWIIARIVKGLVFRLMKRINLDKHLAGTSVEGEEPTRLNLEKWVSIAAFYLIMLFVLVAFFQTVQLPAVATPLNAMLEQIALAAPQLVGALLILLLAWVSATVVKFVILRTMQMTKLDERLAAQADLEEPGVNFTESLAKGVYWLVFLIFLPAVLNSLGMQGLVEPVTGVVDAILGAIPSIFAAGLSLLVGWLIARIVRRIVVNLLVVTKIDQFGERIGVSGDTQPQPLSKIIGTVVYILILIPAVIAALTALGVEAISAPAVSMLTTVLNGIPAFFGAVLVLVVAYYAGKLVSNLVSNLLTGIGFDKVPEILGLSVTPREGQRSLSEFAGIVALVTVLLLAGIEAANMVGFAFFADVLATIMAFGSQILLAMLIFAIGLYLANLARSLILAAGGENPKLVANLVRIAIMVFVAAMALQQVGVTGEIVNITFGVLLGAIGIASALAFGLGSRETAGRVVEEWMKKLEGKGK